jgi:hypothetical protein
MKKFNHINPLLSLMVICLFAAYSGTASADCPRPDQIRVGPGGAVSATTDDGAEWFGNTRAPRLQAKDFARVSGENAVDKRTFQNMSCAYRANDGSEFSLTSRSSFYSAEPQKWLATGTSATCNSSDVNSCAFRLLDSAMDRQRFRKELDDAQISPF